MLLISASTAPLFAQNYIWQSNVNTNWTRNQNWGGSGRPGGTSGYGGTGGRLDFRGNAAAAYNPVGQGFGAAISTFTLDRGLVIGNTFPGNLSISSGAIRLINTAASINNSPAMANAANAVLSITGTGRLDASGNVNDFVFYWGGAATNTSTLDIDGANAQFVGNTFNLRRASGGTGSVNVRNSARFAVSRIAVTGGTGSNILNFNGGILQARASDTNFFGSPGVSLANTSVNIQTGGININSNGFDIGVGQRFSGSGPVSKTGAGTLTFSGNNNYAGTTNIQDGVLILDGNHAGGAAYSVAATGQLGGNGSTTSNVTVSGQVFGGSSNGIGDLRVGGLQLNNASSTRLRLDSNSLDADTIGISANGLTILNGATLQLNDLGSTTVANGTRISLAGYNGGWNGGLWTLGGNLLANNSEIVVGLNRWLFRYNDSASGSNSMPGSYLSFVTIQAVPEPQAIWLIAIASVSAKSLSLRRRRLTVV